MDADYLTWDEIVKRYPDEWVLLDRPKTDRVQNVLGGWVVCHSPDREAIYARMGEMPTPFELAVLYAGPATEEDVLYLL